MKGRFDMWSVASVLAIVGACVLAGWQVYGSGSSLRTEQTEPPASSKSKHEKKAKNEGSEEKSEPEGEPEGPVADAGVASSFGYRLAKPDQTFTLDKALNEISDLALADDNESLWAVGDEKGTLYRLAIKDGAVQQTVEFHKKGDFEGIAVANGQVIAARSDGEVFIVDPVTSTSTRFMTAVGVDCNVEGLAYDAHVSRLLMACKSPQGDKQDRSWVVYSLDLETHKLDKQPALVIRRKAVEAYLTQHAGDHDLDGVSAAQVDPSGIAIQPKTGLFFLISTRGQLLMVIDAKGSVLRIEKLNRDVHLQPEGIAFGADSTLFISNEARGKSPLLHRFSYVAGQ